MKSTFGVAVLLVFASASMSALHAGTPAGMWNATVRNSGIDIPFLFEIKMQGSHVDGSFFNGEERVQSTSGSFEGGKLLLRWEQYASRLEAVVENGGIEGTYYRSAFPTLPFSAKLFTPPVPPVGAIPSISGTWVIPVTNAKNEGAWRFVVRQSGAAVSASVLRVDGDTGFLSGHWINGKFLLSHFSGARPARLEVAVASDGSLDLVQNGTVKLKAVRSTEAKVKGMPEPADPSRWTSLKDPSKPFHFSAPDMKGKVVSNTDPQFRGKVVIISIGGSWCPNCHDEAPLFVELYRKYHAKGLEIVDLSFEEADQLKDPTRLRAFVKQYGIPYTVLLAGETEKVNQVLPEVVNLNVWPATFILGRDGLVRASHAGFAGKATGELHEELVRELDATLAKLLAEKSPGR